MAPFTHRVRRAGAGLEDERLHTALKQVGRGRQPLGAGADDDDG